MLQSMNIGGLRKSSIKRGNIQHSYGARNYIKHELDNLMSLLLEGKDVKLWLDSYNEIVKLSNGDINAQPNIILNERCYLFCIRCSC